MHQVMPSHNDSIIRQKQLTFVYRLYTQIKTGHIKPKVICFDKESFFHVKIDDQPTVVRFRSHVTIVTQYNLRYSFCLEFG